MAVKAKMLLAAKGMTVNDLAEKVEPGTSSQNPGRKLKRDNLTEKDIRVIAKACGAAFVDNFILDDGTKIRQTKKHLTAKCFFLLCYIL